MTLCVRVLRARIVRVRLRNRGVDEATRVRACERGHDACVSRSAMSAPALVLPTIVSPDIECDEARSFIREVALGQWRFSDRRWSEHGRTFLFEKQARPTPATRRELEVLALIARGAANVEAGYELGGLTGSTVCTYATQLAERMGASILDLVAFGPLLERADRR